MWNKFWWEKEVAVCGAAEKEARGAAMEDDVEMAAGENGAGVILLSSSFYSFAFL